MEGVRYACRVRVVGGSGVSGGHPETPVVLVPLPTRAPPDGALISPSTYLPTMLCSFADPPPQAPLVNRRSPDTSAPVISAAGADFKGRPLVRRCDVRAQRPPTKPRVGPTLRRRHACSRQVML